MIKIIIKKYIYMLLPFFAEKIKNNGAHEVISVFVIRARVPVYRCPINRRCSERFFIACFVRHTRKRAAVLSHKCVHPVSDVKAAIRVAG